jgi:hypothetical protein
VQKLTGKEGGLPQETLTKIPIKLISYKICMEAYFQTSDIIIKLLHQSWDTQAKKPTAPKPSNLRLTDKKKSYFKRTFS